ncbi:MAG: ferritin [Thermoguttaceae bacterium]|nr:ferritin [Thermoguttaceae bacterium]MDW8080033.1 ferritin [Thermoguttaceae bacterium]
MLSEKLVAALNDQLNAEYYSSYLYLAMSAHCEAEGFPGMGHWLRKQSEEELGHAMKFYRFILDRGARVELKSVEAPPNRWQSPLALFENVLEHERKVTQRIWNLIDLSGAEKDPATRVFLHWFVDEQVEEEAQAALIVQRLRLVGDSINGLFIIDRELSTR